MRNLSAVFALLPALALMVTLTNKSLSDQVGPNGIGSTASSALLNIDTDLFNANAAVPGSVGQQRPLGTFDVSIAPGVLDGGYVHSPISTVPEPSTCTLSAAGFSLVIADHAPTGKESRANKALVH